MKRREFITLLGGAAGGQYVLGPKFDARGNDAWGNRDVPPFVSFTTLEGTMVEFLYDPRTGRCVAWTLNGDIFSDDDRKVATSDVSGNVYALDGKLVGHLDGTGLVATESRDAFAQLLTKAVQN